MPEEVEECTPKSGSYPEDNSFALQDIQALGTHNSYHIETSEGLVPEWEYTHPAIEVQLASQGIRQLELDLYFNEDTQEFDVLHVPFLDPGSNCDQFKDCVAEVAAFSKSSPGHHPILVLLEFKDEFKAEHASERLALVESQLLNQLGEKHLIQPIDVQRDHASLREALEAEGWPSLGELRGRSLWVLHNGSRLREHYVSERSSKEWTLFPDANGSLDLDYAAVHALNDPFSDFDAIQRLVLANHLVRTRADSDLEEPRVGDTSRLRLALESGAHFVSTDVPTPRSDLDYIARIPEGTPSRCNPLISAAHCQPEDIESPEKLSTCGEASGPDE